MKPHTKKLGDSIHDHVGLGLLDLTLVRVIGFFDLLKWLAVVDPTLLMIRKCHGDRVNNTHIILAIAAHRGVSMSMTGSGGFLFTHILAYTKF